VAVWTDAEFDGFVDSRIGALVRLGFALTGDLGRAEDLVQAALVRLWLRGRHVAPDDPERYVNHAMIRANLRRLPFRRRRRPEPLFVTLDAGPLDLVAARSRLAAPVRQAFAALPPPQRTALALRYPGGLDDAEIAGAMGVSAGLVGSLTSRGLARLRAVADPDDPLDPMVAVALTPPGGLWARPDAGLRLRAQARLHGIRRAEAAVAGIAAALALLLVAGWLVGIGESHRPNGFVGEPPGVVYGPGTLNRPIEVVRVRSARPAPCRPPPPGRDSRAGVVVVDDSCVEIDRRPALVVSRVADLEVINASSSPAGVAVTFFEADAATYRAFTATHVGGRVAFVADGQIWATAEIRGPADAAMLTIPLNRADYAQRLVHTLRSGVAVPVRPSPTR
jgi:RNA polymerase sigma factor (sigma-70 family)